MTWHETTDVEQWLAASADLLFHDPARHTIALTLAASIRAQGPGPRLAWWWGGSDVTGAVMHAPGMPVLLCVVPDEAIRPLGALWPEARFNGPTALAVQVARVLAEGRRVEVLSAQRLFRLTRLRVPDVPGGARPATAADAELLITWFDAFLTESGIVDPTDARTEVPARIAAGRLLVWDDHGVRAMAGRHDNAFGAVRVGPVYTPPAERGKGYGGAVTAAVTQAGLDLGAREVVLFTDLTNPTSNALYPRLGYAPVEDRAVVRLGEPQVANLPALGRDPS